MLAPLITLAAPALLLIAAGLAFACSGRRPARVPVATEALGLLALAGAILAGVLLTLEGPSSLGLPLLDAAGLRSRLDVVSATLLVLVSFVGWVVLRYTRSYLDGEARQGAFTGWLCLTLAAVLLLVQSGHLVQLCLGWTATTLALRRLLLFYPDRLAAQRVAAKQATVMSVSDLALLAAAAVLAWHYGTGDVAALLEAARSDSSQPVVVLAASLLALSALLKSAQFPAHGWLTEVMETPTPVSALLHAGLINAGGFLLIRFADVMLLAPGVLAALVMLGGLTALFGSCVMLTQPAVKTSLAWSTVAQMGFMCLQCGLGLFTLALLHIVAHSLYKAHAFLASGGAVQLVAAARRPGPVAVPRGWAVAQAFATALVLYALIGFTFGMQGKSAQAVALGAILVLGVAYLLAQGFADAAPRALARRTGLYSVVASLGYFLLHDAFDWLCAGTLPAPPQPGALEWVLMVLAILSFGAVAIAQATFPLWAGHPAVTGLRVHLANGLYLNALFDRLLDGWRLHER